MNNLTQKLDKCRTWWDFRNRIEKDLGYLRFERKPIHSGSINLPKNVNDTWNYSVLLLTEFERSVHEYDINRIKLRKITVLDGWRIIPTCPNPFEELPSRNLDEFTSLGIRLSYGIHELWFMVRLRKGGSAIDWNLEVGERLNPSLQIVMFIFTAIWIVIVGAISLGLLIGIAGPVGGLIWAICVVLCGISSGQPSRDDGAFHLIFAIIFWPTKLFSAGKEKRLDQVEENKSLIMRAWQNAQIEVMESVEEEKISPVAKLPEALPVAAAPSAPSPVVENSERRRRD